MPTASARGRQAHKRARPVDLHCYDGRTLIGVLRPRGKKIAAYAVTGTTDKRIGLFKTQRAAVRAIPASTSKQIRTAPINTGRDSDVVLEGSTTPQPAGT